MNIIFEIVYRLLVFLSNLTGLTYREINIIVYFMIIPFLYFNLLDKLIGKHYFKIGFGVICLLTIILVRDFEKFSYKLFDYLVIFLNWFIRIGWNYTVASVIICVFVPVLIYMALLYFVRRKNKIGFLWMKFQ